ncbi:MAG: fasciclin domain-containing protein [Anaerolineae bacterium]
MFKRIASLVLVVGLFAAAVPFAAAAEQPTIVEIAVEDGRFDTLVAAVKAAGLADALSGGEWTVFAPTDEAFAKLDLNPSNVASAFTKDELTDILLYHALEGAVTADEALTLLGDVTMANGQRAGLKYFAGDIYVNDDSKVIIPDIVASNGVIHVVDTVILGPWPKTDEAKMGEAPVIPAGGSIVDIAVSDGRFDTLVAAVKAAGLADALSGGEWTVFAPTDEAFAKLDLNPSNVASAFTKDELTDILLYHALEGAVTADEALTLLGDVTMANGQRAGLKYFAGDIYVNDDSKVIIPDVVASNGVIHVVDTVILGPWPKTGE